MNEFGEYHPAVSFLYFALIIVFSMFFMHPICLLFSFFGAGLYLLLLRRAKNVLFAIPVFLIAVILNPLFNHSGATILFYMRNGNPFTLESVYFGAAAALMIGTVICWFSCFNAVTDREKIIYLFGKTVPVMSLILSMAVRIVSEFKRKIREINDAQRGLNGNKGRFKNAMSVFNALVTASLEDAVETADSMICRGYGLKGRTAYSDYIFTKRDTVLSIVLAALGVYIISGVLCGGMKFRYFPTLSGGGITPYSISVFAAYFILCIMPVIIEITEAYRWKAIKSKI